MKTIRMGWAVAAVVAVAAAAPLGAQTQSWGLGLHTGWLNTGSLGEGEPNDVDIKLEDGWTGGANLEWWFGGRRVGMRFDGNYASRPYRLETGEHEPTFITNTTAGSGTEIIPLDSLGRTETWFADASLMLRLIKPSVDNRFAPFVSLGGGFARWDHEGDTDIAVGEANTYIQGDDQSEWVLNGSIGADFFLTSNIALRAELKDYWNKSSPYTFITDATDHQEGAHNQIASLGLQFMFGGERVSEPGFISAAPTPAPAPAPVVAAAPPAPTTESVSMCYVDQGGRLQTVSATRNLSNGSISVSRNGQDVPFATAYPASDPYYVRSASWYVSSRPLVLDLGSHATVTADSDTELPANRIEFVNFGSTQPIASSELVYVGAVDGTPFYARSTDVGTFQTDLEARMRVTNDLNRMLEDATFADRYVNEIGTFYVPVEPAAGNCVFQPLSSAHAVRRTRG
jgi:hypothetical protein